MGSVSIDLSLANIWRRWFQFRRGKKVSQELECFQYFLERNLFLLCRELNGGSYQHGGYRHFTVTDNKRRQIAVASIKDKVIHRLLYEYLIPIYDKTFIFDVWSCREDKGLIGVIERTQIFLRRYSNSFVWRVDINKFFDHVDHDILRNMLRLKISDDKALWLLDEVIKSYSTTSTRESNPTVPKGMPIGNLTSQIFANIYLNELDRFVKHALKPQAYLRYGDDFILIEKSKGNLLKMKEATVNFLKLKLNLTLHPKNDIIIKAKQRLRFLGVEIFPKGRRLNKRNSARAQNRLSAGNVISYSGLVRKHGNKKRVKEFNWIVLRKLTQYEI